MPEFVPTANVAEVSLRGLLWGQQVQNTLNFSHVGGAIAETELQELASEMNTFWAQIAQPWLARAYTFLEVYAVDLTTATSNTATSNQGAGWSGDDPSGTNTLPGFVTFCISFRSNGRGRSQRGRNYWPGIPQAQYSANQIQTAYAMSIKGVYASLLPGGVYPMSGWQWVIVSRVSNGQPRPAGSIIPVTEVTWADLNLDVQRRRATGRGN